MLAGELPREFRAFLEELEKYERRHEIPWRPDVMTSGRKMLRALFSETRGQAYGARGVSINVIPPVGRTGHCRSLLLVAIGTRDSVERRILEAVEHVRAKCADITRYIVLYAAKWDHGAWLRHSQSFAGSIVVLKMVGQPPARLT